jgi:hypothetical protein
MTNADCWARVVEARTKRERLMPQRVWTLHKGEHAAVIDVKAGAGHRCGNRAHGRQEWLVWWSSTRSKRKGGVSIDETKRAELIAALHQTATFGEGLLNQSERLINALVTGENRPDAEGDRLHARKAGPLARADDRAVAADRRHDDGAAGPVAATPAGRGRLHTKFASRREHNSRAVPDPITWRTRDAILGPSVHVVGLGLTPREYEGHHVGTHER